MAFPFTKILEKLESIFGVIRGYKDRGRLNTLFMVMFVTSIAIIIDCTDFILTTSREVEVILLILYYYELIIYGMS